MIKSEEQLKYESQKTGIFGCIIAAGISLFLSHFGIFSGYVLGFLVSLVIYDMNCKRARDLLKYQQNNTYMNYLLFFLIKFLMYAVGLILAIKNPHLLNVFAVAIGYTAVKMTIFRLAIFRR